MYNCDLKFKKKIDNILDVMVIRYLFSSYLPFFTSFFLKMKVIKRIHRSCVRSKWSHRGYTVTMLFFIPSWKKSRINFITDPIFDISVYLKVGNSFFLSEWSFFNQLCNLPTTKRFIAWMDLPHCRLSIGFQCYSYRGDDVKKSECEKCIIVIYLKFKKKIDKILDVMVIRYLYPSYLLFFTSFFLKMKVIKRIHRSCVRS